MNRTEESRQRRREKARRTNIIAAAVIVGVLVLLFLLVRGISSFGKSKTTDTTKPGTVDTNQKDANDKNKDTETKQTDDKEPSKDNEQDKNSEEDKKINQEERQKLEAERKEKYKEFYVPLPLETKTAEDKNVKGLYVTQTTAAYEFNEDNIKLYEEYIKHLKGEVAAEPAGLENVNNLEKILAICNQTEVNALVIDIKSDDGYLTWNSDVEVFNQLKTVMPASSDNFKKLLDYMKDHDIYPMARIVVFKDFVLPEIKPEHAMQLNEGGKYTDDQGMPWVNQYDKFVWDYVLAASKEAALRGFKEIHFDYIRFPDNAAHYNEIVNFPGRDGKRKDDNIHDFIMYAKQELEPYGVKVGAAVFGIITKSWEDKPEDIGQTWIKIANGVDIISPMIYPSHYSTGWYGYEYPDAHPYGVFNQSLREALEKNSSIEKPAKIRPWIQGFTAPWVDGHIDYTPEVIAEQVKAGVELGIDEYLVWNAVNEYNPRTFIETTKFSANQKLDAANLPDYNMEMLQAERDGGEASLKDILGRSPYAAIAKYLNALSNTYYDETYLLTKRSERQVAYSEYNEAMGAKALKAENYEVTGVSKIDSGYEFTVNATFSSNEGRAALTDGKIKVILEDNMFKIIPPELKFEPVSE